MGHLQIFRHNFPEKGIGSPATFAIEDHQELQARLREDEILGPLIYNLTGQLTFSGLANYYPKNTSAAFIGFGFYPEDYAVFSSWNPYGLAKPDSLPINDLLYEGGPWLDEFDPEGGSLGIGLAEVLEIAPPNSSTEKRADSTANSAAPAATSPPKSPATESDVPNFDVIEAATAQASTSDIDQRPRIELLCVPEAGAAPNVQTLAVRAARPFENVQLDDRLVLMHIEHASKLLFPGQPTQVTSLRLLLKDGRNVDLAASRIREILAESYPKLECRTWIELAPFYEQITAYLQVIFLFMASIIACIVVFTIYNTLAAAIVERTVEIGTLRAMGVNRGRIATLFLSEAVFMGIAGGLLGVLLAIVLGYSFNGMNFLFNPPSTAYYTKVEVVIFRSPLILLYGFLIAVGAAVLSAILPSVKASRMAVVDALRHA
jgi:putative ABC transport system permease protein